jgi:hypothetical protein
MNEKVDKERYQASIARLEEIFRGISDTTNQVSTWRCPYKNAQDRCTAGFRCRNQSKFDIKDNLSLCTGSDNLDYRAAWEV